VSNFNGARFLPRLLESLRTQRSVQVEIIVVDRKSRDDSRRILASSPGVIMCEELPETGLVSGYARGAGIARHEHLFFCNEDMWFDEECLARLERQIDWETRVVVADPWQWTYDGAKWIHGGTRFRRCRWTLLNAFPFSANEFTESLPEFSSVPFPCAGAFMIHRKAYDRVGGWDCSFFLDYEDVDLGIRLWQRGFYCVTVPAAKVYHAVNASNSLQLSVTKEPVSRRRYISGRASVSIIGLKYFSGINLVLPGLVWAAMAANNARRLRLRRLWWDVLAVREIIKRFPAALSFRRVNRTAIYKCPGQRFFNHRPFLRESVRPYSGYGHFRS
jgi:GT2 family glycosyltransferase